MTFTDASLARLTADLALMEDVVPTAIASAQVLDLKPRLPDPYLWLEAVEGKRAQNWVRTQNARTLAELTQDARYADLYRRALDIVQDKSRIPQGTLRDGFVYNLWQDETNVRGLWRRTTEHSYETTNPKWEPLLDLDALSQKDGCSWVFGEVLWQSAEGTRCMLSLSDGGKDACRWHEFDLKTKSFVEVASGGFYLPEAKGEIAWKDENTLLVSTDFGEDTMTEAGYPFVVKEWSRGTNLSQAREIYRGAPSDLGVGPFHLEAAQDSAKILDKQENLQTDKEGIDFAGKDAVRIAGKNAGLLLIISSSNFFDTQYFSYDNEGNLQRITIPQDAEIQGICSNELIFQLKQDWVKPNRTWKSGSLLSIPRSQIFSENAPVRAMFEPGERDIIEEVGVTAAGVLATQYTNVRGRLLRYTFSQSSETWRATPIVLPDNGSISLVSVNEMSPKAYVTYESFVQPATLYAVDVACDTPKPIKSAPVRFDCSKYKVEQLEATSKDGTQVPYFVVRAHSLVNKSPAPTLMYGYGGFGVSILPTYSGTVGELWLEEGGVYVLASIRGGGELGPAWHQAALKTRRQVGFDDFIAVAEDIIERGITSPKKLGIEGDSNGGLLMGVMLNQRPDLFNAAVVQVPLLDMLRYDKLLAGASWVEEYGSPDNPQERAWLEKMSPYHNLVHREDFTKSLILTSTKDDRVHPGHARKFAAKIEALGMPFLYYENTEGGHSAAADLHELAHSLALEYTYLSQQLRD